MSNPVFHYSDQPITGTGAGGAVPVSGGGGVQQVEGTGIPGTPAGDVLTVQGDPAGTPIPVDTELPAAAALSDAVANPTTPIVGSALMLWDSVNTLWKRARGASSVADGGAGDPLVAAGIYGRTLGAATFDRLTAAGDDVAHAVGALGRLIVVGHTYGYDTPANNWKRALSNPDGALQAWRPSTLAVSVAGGANAIATLTLPAPGAGLFIYLTYLYIARVSTAALAGGAVLTVTSTNLPGTPSYRTGNQMSITVATPYPQPMIDTAFPFPLKATAANTAVTFVGPAAGAAVSWHMTAHYFTAA